MFFDDKWIAVFDTDLGTRPEAVCDDEYMNKYERAARLISGWFIAEGDVETTDRLHKRLIQTARRAAQPNPMRRISDMISGKRSAVEDQHTWIAIAKYAQSTPLPARVWDAVVGAAVKFRGNRAKGYVGTVCGSTREQALVAAQLQMAACMNGQPIR